MIIKDKSESQNANSVEQRNSMSTGKSSNNVVSLTVARQQREEAKNRIKEIKILEAASKLGW